jgi:hypothetical protein
MKTLLSITFSLLVSGFSVAQTKPAISDFTWILGDWELKKDNGIIYESWSKLDASTLHGISYRVQGADTLVLETVQLKCNAAGCAYIPVANGQNDGKPVIFTITSALKDSFVAENPAHDFPKKITYARNGSRLDAAISGDGKEIRYPFVSLVQ